MTTFGTIAEIWRYPVKSMAGEQLERCAIGPGGLVGDRGWAVRDEQAGATCSAKQHPKLLQCAARYLDEPHDAGIAHVEITLPDGSTVRTDTEDAHQALSIVLGRPVTLCPAWVAQGPLPATPRRAYFDVATYHLLTTASLNALQALAPDARIDVRRFRPNLLIQTPGDVAGFVEFDWTGSALRIGDVSMTAGDPVPRCGMTAAAQPGLPKDPAILRTIARELNHNLGIYGATNATGTINVGDAVVHR